MKQYRIVVNAQVPDALDVGEFIEDTMLRAIEADALSTFDMDKADVVFTITDVEDTTPSDETIDAIKAAEDEEA